MSGLGWQDAVVALLALAAAGYLVRRKWRARTNAAACSDCPGCATATTTNAGEDAARDSLVTLQRSPRSRDA